MLLMGCVNTCESIDIYDCYIWCVMVHFESSYDYRMLIMNDKFDD